MDIERDFNELYHTHAPKVYRLCLGYASGDEDLAREWQQETFVKVWKYRATFKAQSAVSTWIYRIAVNTCLGDLRKSKKLVPLDGNLPEQAAAPEEKQDLDQQIEKMYRCIGLLSHHNKAAILLELEEVPQAGIAEALGMAHGALRTRLSRIRQTLLKCITNEN